MVETKIHQRFLENLNVRNILDNGGFEIWQRGTGPWSVSGDITADRWMMRKTSVSMLVSKETTEVMKGTGALKCEITVAGIMVNLRQTVYMAELEGGTVSLSIWIKTTISNKVRLWIRDAGGDAFSGFHSGSGNWEKLTMTKLIVGDYLTVNFGIHEDDVADVTGIIYADNAMLVVGPDPMDFVPMSPAEELMRCQRYYATSNFRLDCTPRWDTAISALRITIYFPVRMQAVPTVTFQNTSSNEVNLPFPGSVVQSNFDARSSGTSAGRNGWILGDWYAEVT